MYSSRQCSPILGTPILGTPALGLAALFLALTATGALAQPAPACGAFPPNGGGYECACSGSETGSVWGSGPYTADSNICVAARHAGVIAANGGVVRAFGLAGRESYAGSAANGVSSSSWGSYGDSFDFPRVMAAAGAAPTRLEACGAYPADAPEYSCGCSGTETASVWGSGPFTADSGICTAARFAGVIGADGGNVTAYAHPGQASYLAGNGNGVATSAWGSYGNSFDFTMAMAPAPAATPAPGK